MRRILPLLGLVVVAAFVGCGPSLVPVSGSVTGASETLSSGSVTFHPTATDGHRAEGTLSGGQYTLYTDGEEGAAPGKYKVTVVATSGGGTGEGADAYAVPKQLVAAAYADAKSTPLEVEVSASPAAGAYDLEVKAP